MSKLEELIQEFCPDGVKNVEIAAVCSDIFAGGDLPLNYVKGQKLPSDEFPYPIYSNGTEEAALYGYTDGYRVEKESITISARGTIGYHAIREGKFTPIVRLITLTANENKVITKFLNYSLSILGIAGVSTGIPSLTIPMLKKYEIPLPPLPIQQEIVRILDTFTALEAELEAELEKRKTQYEYYRKTLIQSNSCFPQKQLLEILNMRAGKNISAVEISDTKTSEFPYPCYGGNGLRGYVKKAAHSQSAVIIGRQGALCGNVKRVSGEFYPTEHAVVVCSKQDINIDWAFHVLSEMNLNQFATKSAQPGLSVKRIEQLSIPVPPLPEQERIVAILDSFDALVNDISQGLPAEIAARRKQYEYYRDKLLTFKELEQ